MTYLKLKSGAQVPRATVVDYYPYLRSSASTHLTAPQAPELPPATDPREAANDEGPRKWYQIRNPLWVIVIGMAFLFTVMALFVALG
jgi:hypothetical protein